MGKRTFFWSGLVALTVFCTVALGMVPALGDNFQNDVTAGGSDTFTSPGSTMITYALVGNNEPH